jgi:uncharacterized protein
LFVIPLSAEGGEPRRFLVYAPLRQAAFVANARTVNLIADLQAGVGSPELAAAGELMEFLRRLEMVGAGPEPRPVTEFSGEPRPTAVTLFLTTACNLRCTYCYASAGDTPLRAMPLAVARRGIDFVLGNALARGAPGIEVSYHGGGEPTANWRTLTESFAYAEERAAAAGLALESSTATNAVLSEAQIDWIVAHLDGASVSCDGLPEAHDRHRPMVSGQGSSARVAHTLRRFDAAGFPYGVRVTVTADQIARLPESIEYLCTQFRTPRIQVEPAYQMGRWENAPSAETEGFIAAYREAQACAARHGRELSYSAARVGVLTNHFCGITQDSFSLSPDGNVSACHEVFSEENRWADVFFYGRPATAGSGYAFDVARLAHLRAQGVQHRAYCRGCFAKWTCAGDCYHKAIGVSGSTEFRGSDRCHITRELTKDQVLARIAAAGGLFWHEPPGAAERPAGKELFL